MTEPTPLYEPRQDTPMYVAGLMSGSGTNLRKILEYQERLKRENGSSPFEMKVIFTDNMACKAAEIAKDYKIGCLANDIDSFYRLHGFAGKASKDMSKEQRRELRQSFDAITLAMLNAFSAQTGFPVDCTTLGGYMSYLTEILLDNFLNVNVHPAPLDVLDERGQRKYKGDYAVRDQIKAGEMTISSSMHIARQKVDEGELLMVSSPLVVDFYGHSPGEVLDNPALLKIVADKNQERLKEAGDWIIFPKTLEMIARGWIAKEDEEKGGKIYYKTSDEGEWKEGPMRLDRAA